MDQDDGELETDEGFSRVSRLSFFLSFSAVCMAVYASGGISGGILNPSLTIALAGRLVEKGEKERSLKMADCCRSLFLRSQSLESSLGRRSPTSSSSRSWERSWVLCASMDYTSSLLES